MRLNQVFMLIVASAGIVGMGVASCQPQRAFDTEATAPAQTSPAQTSPAQTSQPASQPQAVDRDVPYVPTPESVVAEMLRVANVSQNDVIYDLGSGDGRIVITAAQEYGARGMGVDIDPALVQQANDRARQAGVSDRVQFVQQDLFETDISEATVVTLYLLPDVNLRLRPKLLEELRPGTRIVSHSFDMGDWEPEQVTQVDGRTIYYWVVPEEIPASLRS
ncbi:MAG: class I SAM-dependent methyltransferase [Pegethrix bostrychoides GSE-TBD4-15B]|uniref:Class I SAM-dependent methyltransferase n=1 Tax=Pegethrix bostrychoides GSE-TBD4-15B TaxID=2839662 RepID=A0A951P922_9CYAN|nr:class I SAM-dependent methyltransferase [Pegethrix bostrychoides GSE-TBD4-15B]